MANLLRVIRWLGSRVAVIYIIVIIFSLTCVDFKTLNDRIKVRRLNQAIPNFTDMINFSVSKNEAQALDWSQYRHYFNLIVRYVPDDMTARQLLGYVEYFTGQEQKAIKLFKSSSEFKGHLLFWSNYNLGVLYYKKGMWPLASEYLVKAISASPQLNLVLMRESIIYKQIFNNPAFTYDIDDEFNDAKSNAFILLLSSLQHMGEYNKILGISKLAIENKDLTNKDIFYYNAGLAFYQTGAMQSAFILFQKSLTLEKNNPDVYYYLAKIYQNLGQTENAREYLQISYVLHQKNNPRFPIEAQVGLRFF